MKHDQDHNDTLTYRGANELAARIRDYWTRRGYSEIQTFVLQVNAKDYSTIYCVRSNIGPLGFPERLPSNDNVEEFSERKVS